MCVWGNNGNFLLYQYYNIPIGIEIEYLIFN